MDDAVRAVVNRTAVLSAGIAAVLSPIPMADEVVFIPVLGVMAWRIGRVHGLRAAEIPWRPVAMTAAAGLVARATVNLAFALIPGVAAVSNAVSAVTLTRLMGTYVDTACADPSSAKPWRPRDFVPFIRPA